MFDCNIADVSASTVRIAVHVVHPDQWDVSGEKNFALQAIVDAFWRCKMDYLHESPSNERTKYKNIADASPIKDELDELIEMMHGRKEPITKTEYGELNRGNTEGVSSWGADGENYYKQYPTDYNAFCRAAERIIKRVQLVDECDNPKQNEDDPYPSATLVIELVDEKYAAHLSAGMHWETAIYAYDYYRTTWDTLAFFDAESCPDFNTRSAVYDPFEGPQETGTPENAAFSEDGTKLLFSSQMGEVVAFENDRELWRIPPERMFAELSVRNDLVVLGDSEYFSIIDGSPIEGPGKASGRCASKSGTYEVNYGDEEALTFLDGREIKTPDVVEACAFTNDESKVAIGGMFNEIIIADPKTAETLSIIKTTGRCGTLSFSPDGTLLAVGVDGTTIEIYDVTTGTLLTKLSGKHYLTSTTWSPDGSSLIITHVTNRHGYDGYFVRYPMIYNSTK